MSAMFPHSGYWYWIKRFG